MCEHRQHRTGNCVECRDVSYLFADPAPVAVPTAWLNEIRTVRAVEPRDMPQLWQDDADQT